MKKLMLVTSLCIFLIPSTLGQPNIRWIFQRGDTVGLYEKFELSLNMEAEYVNPFDPGRIQHPVFTRGNRPVELCCDGAG